MTKRTRYLLAVISVTIAILLGQPQSALAGSHTWSGAVDGNWSTAGNWSAGGVPTLAETNLLTFPAGATRTITTNNIGALKVSAFSFSGSNYIIRGAPTFTIESNLLNVNASGGSNTVESPLAFVSVGVLTVGSSSTLVLAGALSGTNGLTKFGAGNLFFRGAASNPLSGLLNVYSGELHFQKTGVASPYIGNSISIGNTDPGDPTQLFLYANDQIPDGAAININASGALQMNAFTDIVGDVSMLGGVIDSTGGGRLKIDGDLTLTPRVAGTNQLGQITYESPTLWGTIEFNGTSRNINVTSNTANIDAVIAETGSVTALNKIGPGTLSLRAANTFTGQLNVLQGTVFATDVNSLGSVAGNTVVSNGASLKLPAGVTVAEPLVLSGPGDKGAGALQLDVGGNTTCSGLITLSNLARIAVPITQQLQLSGVVAGPGGIEKIWPGDLALSGVSANTFAGASFVNDGKMQLNKPASTRAIASVTVTNGAFLVFNNNEQMDNAGILSLYSSAIVNLTNRNETIGGLNIGIGQTLDTGAGTLTLLGNIFSGPPYSTNANHEAILRGQLSLGGATRNVTTTNGNAVMFDCAISDGAGVGGLNLIGTMWLLRSNSFTGPVTVDGFCRVSNNWAFGAPGGGVLFPSNSYYANDIFLYGTTAISGETLTVASAGINWLTTLGTNAWNGPIGFTNATSLECDGYDTSDLTLSGSISGSNNLLQITTCTVRLLGTNTYPGLTWTSGRVIAGNPQALGSTNRGTEILPTGALLLNMPNGAQISGEALLVDDNSFDSSVPVVGVIGGVSNTWAGPVTNYAMPLRLDAPSGNTLKLDATITGSGGLEKTGFGNVILAGSSANTYAGDTEVRDGYFYLAKPNGVRAVANLTVTNFAEARWNADRQMADGATLRLFRGNADLRGHNETISQLATDMGWLTSQTGTLTLLGDIDATPDPSSWFGNSINGRVCLSAGTHRVFSATTNWGLSLNADIGETNGVASLSVSNLPILYLYGSNTYSGLLNLANTPVQAGHPLAFGSPAQGVIADQWSAIVLDLYDGQGVAGESLLATNSAALPYNLFRFGTTNEVSFSPRTNFWSGPIIADSGVLFAGTANQSLDLRGPLSTVNFLTGDYYSSMKGTLLLTGTNSNQAMGGLMIFDGKLHLAKAPGVSAISYSLAAYTTDGSAPEIHVDASGQTSANAVVLLRGASLLLHDHPTLVGGLIANQNYSHVDCGTNPASALTVNSDLGGWGLDFFGEFRGTLIKQGTGYGFLKGDYLSGDLLVQGGTLDRTCLGFAYQTVISPGAMVKSSGPQIFNFGALSGGGTLHISGVNTWVGGTGNASTFTGAIIGTNTGANLTKVATGTITLTGPISLVSTTLVQNGTLIVNTTMTNPVVVTPLAPANQPTLAGTGSLGNVTLTGAGARIAPGATTSLPSYGTLHVKDLTAGAGSSYLCEIGGTNAGVNLDLIDASGLVTLSGGGALFSAFGAGVVSNRYAVVKSVSPISGTFTGDPEGDLIMPAAGRSMIITYLTSAGKEITLIEQPGPDLTNIQIASITHQTSGQVTLTGTGNSGSTYFIEGNTNLNTTNWIMLGSVLGAWDGGINFTDTNAPSFPQRFYRFRLQ